jgi:hypothetical protein
MRDRASSSEPSNRHTPRIYRCSAIHSRSSTGKPSRSRSVTCAGTTVPSQDHRSGLAHSASAQRLRTADSCICSCTTITVLIVTGCGTHPLVVLWMIRPRFQTPRKPFELSRISQGFSGDPHRKANGATASCRRRWSCIRLRFEPQAVREERDRVVEADQGDQLEDLIDAKSCCKRFP